MAKIFIVIGVGFIILGAVAFLAQRFNLPLGRLPGDIMIKKGNFSFYFPLATCVLASIVLTAILHFFRK